MSVPRAPATPTRARPVPRVRLWLALVLVPFVLIAGAIAWPVYRGEIGRHRIAGTSAPAADIGSAAGRWMPTGLTEEVDALLEDPRVPGHLVAATSDGLWASRDGGATWQREGAGLGHERILALSGTTSGGLLFAGGAHGTIYARRPEAGAGWQRISPSLGADPIFSLAVSPLDGRTLLAGTVGALFRGTRAGGTWLWRRVAATGDSSVAAIGWSSRQVFACVFGTHPPVLRSDDGGAHWRADDRGLPSSLPTEALLPLPGAGGRLLLSTMGGGVWLRSSAGGWREVSAGLPERHAMPMIAGGPGGAVFAGTMGSGIYRWQPGRPWERVGHGATGGQYIVLSLALSGGAHPALLAGTAVGVLRYTGAP